MRRHLAGEAGRGHSASRRGGGWRGSRHDRRPRRARRQRGGVSKTEVDAFGGLDTLVNSAALASGTGSPVDVDLDAWNGSSRSTSMPSCSPRVTRCRTSSPPAAGRSSTSPRSPRHTVTARGAYRGVESRDAGPHARLGVHPRSRRCRVNCILPGHVFTPMGNHGPEVRERHRLAGLLATEGLAWDIAWPAVFLASGEPFDHRCRTPGRRRHQPRDRSDRWSRKARSRLSRDPVSHWGPSSRSHARSSARRATPVRRPGLRPPARRESRQDPLGLAAR